MEKNHFVSVAGLVRNDAGQVLLIESPLRGWEFPGGMVEPGEPLEKALKREIREESGVDVRISDMAGISKNIQSDIVNLDFRCIYLGGELRTSAESIQVGWFTREEAAEKILNPLTKKRFELMVSKTDCIYLFSFLKSPFSILDEQFLSAI